MDYLKEGIGLRAMAQRDPLVEYQREGYNMFNQMMGAIKEESIGFLFNLDVQVEPQLPSTPSNLTFSAPSESGDTEIKAANQDKPNDEGPGSSFFKK
jgi:preprotein translocase subunit SecA